jgi:branched-chain amino acid transport system permease protein
MEWIGLALLVPLLMCAVMMIGGILLGIIEVHSHWQFGPQVRDLFAYFLLFAFLVLRPGGLFGHVPELAMPHKV